MSGCSPPHRDARGRGGAFGRESVPRVPASYPCSAIQVPTRGTHISPLAKHVYKSAHTDTQLTEPGR
eukprot:6643721-Prymnesium_polylepis.1